MRHPIVALTAAAILAGTAAVAAAHTAPDGQTRTQLAAEPPSGPVDPGEAVDVTVEVTYTYQQGGVALADGPTTVLLSVRSAPTWADARFGAWMHEVPLSPGGGSTTAEVGLPVAVDDDAPANAAGDVEVTAYAAENDAMAPSQGSTTIPIEVSDSGSHGGSASTSGSASSPSSASVVPVGPGAVAALVAGAAGVALGRRQAGSS